MAGAGLQRPLHRHVQRASSHLLKSLARDGDAVGPEAEPLEEPTRVIHPHARDFASGVEIEAGDGDELWENRDLARICEIHSDVFALLARFYYEGRFFMLYGNHDRVKARQAVFGVGRAFPFSAPCLQSLIIRTAHESQDLYVLHGHQADLFNDRLWPLARWLVRYLWKPLELAGFRDPTSAARNYRKSRAVEKRLSAWAEDHGKNLLAGHTHRPILPPVGAAGYFNCGSCVHPNGITCIELMSGQLSLIRWEECVNENNALYVCRRLLYGPRCL